MGDREWIRLICTGGAKPPFSASVGDAARGTASPESGMLVCERIAGRFVTARRGRDALSVLTAPESVTPGDNLPANAPSRIRTTSDGTRSPPSGRRTTVGRRRRSRRRRRRRDRSDGAEVGDAGENGGGEARDSRGPEAVRFSRSSPVNSSTRAHVRNRGHKYRADGGHPTARWRRRAWP